MHRSDRQAQPGLPILLAAVALGESISWKVGAGNRLLELAPLSGSRARARLDPLARAAKLRPVAIPAEPLDTSVVTEQEAAG